MPENAKDTSCDLFVIGAGSGGVRASRIAASLGAKVIVAEGLYLGGLPAGWRSGNGDHPPRLASRAFEHLLQQGSDLRAHAAPLPI